MNKTFAEIVAEDRRLAILRTLNEQPAREMNSSNIDGWLRHMRTPGTRADTMLALHFLRDEGLITLAALTDIPGMHIATLTAAGIDVAEGRNLHPGVARPTPR
jgi:hypothetical protein